MSLKSSHKLKQLQSQAASVEADLECLADEQNSAASKQSEASKRLKEIKAEMERLKQTEPVVSEHAIIRFLERVKGLDIEAIKNEMLDEQLKHTIMTLGNGKYPIGNGHHLIIKNMVAVTVSSRKPSIKRKQRR